MAQLSNNPWLGVSPGAEAGVRDWRVQGRHDRGPMDLSVSQNAQQGAAIGGATHASGPWGEVQPPPSPGERYNHFLDTATRAQNASQEAVAQGGILGKIGEFIKKIGVNQDYPGVERDLQGNEIITLPTGEKIIKELWESPGFQDNYFREKRNAR